LYPPQHFRGAQNLDSEGLRHFPIIAAVKGNERVSAAIDRRLQYHLVARILKLRPPPVVYLDRFGEEG
jgi:hypothetical protein